MQRRGVLQPAAVWQNLRHPKTQRPPQVEHDQENSSSPVVIAGSARDMDGDEQGKPNAEGCQQPVSNPSDPLLLLLLCLGGSPTSIMVQLPPVYVPNDQVLALGLVMLIRCRRVQEEYR